MQIEIPKMPEAPSGLAPVQKMGALGIVEWQANWPTLEQAREIVSKQLPDISQMSDLEILKAANVPSPELAGMPVKEEHAPGKICNPKGKTKNILVTVGLSAIVNNMGFGLTPLSPLFRYIAVGSNATAVTSADTQLGTELTTNGWGRVACTITQQTTTLTGDTLQLVGAFTLTGTPGTVQEIAIGNNASANSGTIFTHALTGAITLPAGPVVTFTYKVVFASA